MRMEWMIELIYQQAQLTNHFSHSLSHLKKGKHFLSKQHQTFSLARNALPKNLSQEKTGQNQPSKHVDHF